MSLPVLWPSALQARRVGRPHGLILWRCVYLALPQRNQLGIMGACQELQQSTTRNKAKSTALSRCIVVAWTQLVGY